MHNIERNLFHGFLFFLFFGSLSCNSNEPTSKVKDSVKTTVKIINTPETFEYSAPSEVVYQPKTDDILVDVFYPIGWSKDGMFAYITEPADEATGYYYFTLNIVNCNNGKTEWTWKIDEKNAQEDGSLKETWEKNKTLFVSTLEQFKIRQQSDISVQNFPSIVKNKSYDIKLNIKYTKDAFGYGFDVAGICSAILKSSDGKEKQIFTKDYQNNIILNVSTAGYLKNPFDNQIIVLLKSTRMGYEGPPNIVSFQPVFANLNIP